LSRIESAPLLLAKQRGQGSALPVCSLRLNETAKPQAGQFIFVIGLLLYFARPRERPVHSESPVPFLRRTAVPTRICTRLAQNEADIEQIPGGQQG
jgi:hypothetical protein